MSSMTHFCFITFPLSDIHYPPIKENLQSNVLQVGKAQCRLTIQNLRSASLKVCYSKHLFYGLLFKLRSELAEEQTFQLVTFHLSWVLSRGPLVLKTYIFWALLVIPNCIKTGIHEFVKTSPCRPLLPLCNMTETQFSNNQASKSRTTFK